MATNLEGALELIRAGLQEEARTQLEEKNAVDTGFLRDNTNFTIEGDDFVVRFPDYGVNIDQGTGTSFAIGPRPFYSNLVVTGPEEGVFEDEIEAILEDAFELDVEELEQDLENEIDR